MRIGRLELAVGDGPGDIAESFGEVFILRFGRRVGGRKEREEGEDGGESVGGDGSGG